MDVASKDVQNALPDYADYMKEKRLDVPVVARYLVGWPSKKILASGCMSLEKALEAAARCYALWGLGKKLGEDEAEGKRVNRVETIWWKGKKALVTTACLNTLQNMKGQERKDKCEKMLKDNQEFMDELFENSSPEAAVDACVVLRHDSI